MARLEKALRPLLPTRDRKVELTITRLWSFIDPQGFSQAFAWQLAERLKTSRPAVDQDIVQALLQTVAGGAGALAIKARTLLEGEPARVSEPESFSAPESRVLPVTLMGVSPQGLQLNLQGEQKVVPFTALESVLGGVIPEDNRRSLFVDLVLKVPTGPRTALRLSGADAGVMLLFPGKRGRPSSSLRGARLACRRTRRHGPSSLHKKRSPTAGGNRSELRQEVRLLQGLRCLETYSDSPTW